MFKVQRGLETFGVRVGQVSSEVSYVNPIDTDRGFSRLTSVRLGSAGRDVNTVEPLNNDDFGAYISGFMPDSFSINREATAEKLDHRFYWEALESTEDPVDGFRVVIENIETLADGQLSKTIAAAPGITDLPRNFLWITGLSSERTIMRWPSAAVEVSLDGTGMRTFTRQSSVGEVTISYVQLEMGTAWGVRNLSVAASVAGADTSFSGAGPEPWRNKAIVSSYSVPSLANRQASNLLLRPNLATFDGLFATLPALAQPGTYNGRATVLYHPRLQVAHAYNPNFGGIGIFETVAPVLSSVKVPPERSSMIMQGTNTEAAITYFRQGWGYSLGDQEGTYRRCRADSADPTMAYSQFIAWPEPPRGRQIAGVLEAPCFAQ